MPVPTRVRFMRRLKAWLGSRAGLMASRFFPQRNDSGLFFFFPYYHVGGAEKVHADIVGCFSREKPWVLFTLPSESAKFRPLFEKGGRFIEIWKPAGRYPSFMAGFIAGLVNRHEQATVFGCNSYFFYRMLPLLRPGVRRIDLLHAFGGGIEDFSASLVQELDARVVINSRTLEDYRTQYRDKGIDPAFLERIFLIENRVDIPPSPPKKERGGRLAVLYVGRGTEEKRVHIVGKVAARCRRRGIPADFLLVGSVEAAVDPGDREQCRFAGEISDKEVLRSIYERSEILLITSSREGFPLVVMEAMAHGVVPVSTAVGGIPANITDGKNGFLVTEVEEEAIVSRIVEICLTLDGDRERLSAMSRAAYEHAQACFSGREFCQRYRQIILGRPETPP